jgi:Flp pilus assembly protein TadG
MTPPIDCTRRFIKAFRDDTSGIILPYVAVFMVVFVGLGALAIDVGRDMSLQTQMQAAADAMAIAGARELNQRSGAETRATNAINNLVSNGLSGLGVASPIASATVMFYKNLPAATAGFTGTAATGDADARFVAVTVTPKAIPATFSIFRNPTMSSGAQAIAGQTAQTACNISPVFICNPYETSGMTDAQATQALNEALDPNDPNFNAATLRKLFRMQVVGNNSSPGHFGWVQPADKCNSTPCLKQWISYDSKASLSNSCFSTVGITMATGNKPLASSFNDRFDDYSQSNGPDANDTPSINVRKGYTPGSGASAWCPSTNPTPNSEKPGDYLTAQTGGPGATISLAPVPASGTVSVTTNKSTTLSVPSGTTGIVAGMSIVSGGALGNPSTLGIAAGTTVTNPITSTSVTLSQKAAKSATSGVSFVWLTSPLPLDKQWTGICGGGTCLQGNGNWDCLDYWTINHSTNAGALTKPAPTGCTASNPTVSRYQVYQYENGLASDVPTSSPILDTSGYPRGSPPGATGGGNGETGAPYCAIKKNGFTPTFDSTYDPRILYVSVINCLAQANNIGGGNSGGSVPVAGFAKYFLTQPFGADGSTYLYGEMSGLVGLNDGVVVLNQVQLYR